MGMLSPTKTVPTPAGAVITAITQDAYGHPVITLAAPLPASCNTHLYVYGYVPLPGSPSINGIYRAFPGTVTAGNAATWTLRKRFSPLAPLCNGWAEVYSPTVSVFQQGTFTKPTKKSRGRPTALPRGRARARR